MGAKMTDDLVKRLADIDPILDAEFDTQLNVRRDPYGATRAIEMALYLLRDQADRIEALTAERDRAIDDARDNAEYVDLVSQYRAERDAAKADNARLKKGCECAMSEIRDYMQEVGGTLPLELAMGWLSAALTGRETK